MTGPKSTHARLGALFDRQIVLITGVAHWGAPWAAAALDAHPEACCGSRGRFFDVLAPALQKAAAGLAPEDIDYLTAAAAGLTLERRMGGAGVAETVKAAGDMTPGYIFHLDAARRIFPGVKVVHITADGRAEAAAVWREGGAAMGEKFSNFAEFAAGFAHEWSRAVNEGRRFGREHRDQYLELNARELTGAPLEPLGRLARFLDLDDTPATLGRTAARANAMAPPPPPGPEPWRGLFDEAALRAFRRQAGELLKLLGCED
ncbi:MAG: sulfotransferase [Rhodospirillales bacterium]